MNLVPGPQSICELCGGLQNQLVDAGGEFFVAVAVVCCKEAIEHAYDTLNALDHGGSGYTAVPPELPPPDPLT